MICKPGNSMMQKAIDRCVYNINNNYYGHHPIYPTGPGMLVDIFFTNNYNLKISDFDLFFGQNGKCIFDKNHGVILTHYNEYREEQTLTHHASNYMKLWEERKIYK